VKFEESLFYSIDWDMFKTKKYKGESGSSYWRTVEMDGFRLRMVDYSPGFRSDHFCCKGHIILVEEGMLSLKMNSGGIVNIEKGMSLLIGDSIRDSHQAFTNEGARVFIVD
jgi:hypothetical protein